MITTTAARSARSLNNELSSDLHAAAARLAPQVERDASESGCTNTRPTGSRSARAWDMVRLCHHMNSFCDFEDLSAAFIAVTEGKAATVALPPAGDHEHDEWHCSRCWAADELVNAVDLWFRLFPKGWGTPISRARAEFDRRTAAMHAAQQAQWDAHSEFEASVRSLQRATKTLNDRIDRL